MEQPFQSSSRPLESAQKVAESSYESAVREYRADLCREFKCTDEELERKKDIILKDVPNFTQIPSGEILKDKEVGFKFTDIRGKGYQEGKEIQALELTDKDLQDIGFSDQVKRDEILRAMAEGKEQKGEMIARIFDIQAVIEQKRKEDPNHPDELTMKELYEAIDAAGYRPATFLEMLAFAKRHWSPEKGTLDATTTSEESLQHFQGVDRQHIHALGCVFHGTEGQNGGVALISGYSSGDRLLSGYGFKLDLERNERALVIRK
jgi:hypothetical protein